MVSSHSGTPLGVGTSHGHFGPQDTPRPGLGGSHHLPPHNILYDAPLRLHLNGSFSRDSQVGVPKLSRNCRNPTLAKCGGEAQHLEKSEDLESSGTPECLELDSKAQNTSHWGVLGVIGKVLKRRYRKWPRIGHLDICRPSYGQKKGWESNCQFDS